MLDALASLLHSEGLEMTVTPTSPDLDVNGYQVTLMKMHTNRFYTGRSAHLDSAIAIAMAQYKSGRVGVSDDETARRHQREKVQR